MHGWRGGCAGQRREARPPNHTATTGQNHASCKLRVSDVTPAILTCNITQDNVNGGNHALVQETINQRIGADQDGTDLASVNQFTVNGQNHAQVSQDVNQFTSAAAVQTQDGSFETFIGQQVLVSGRTTATSLRA